MTYEPVLTGQGILETDQTDDCQTYREIFEGAIEGIFRSNIDGSIKIVNPAMIKMLDYDSEQDFLSAVSNSIEHVWVDPDERQRFIDLLEKNEIVRDYETRFYQKNKQIIWVSVSCRLVKRANNDLPYLEGFVENISQRKQAQDLIREQEILFQLLFDAAPDGIVLIDLEGNIIRSNIAQAHMYGYKYSSDLVGIPATQLVAPTCREHSSQILRRRLNGEQIPAVPYQLLRKDGSIFFGETTATILHNDQGEVSGYICVTRDTTERTKAEMEIRDTKQLLESVIDNIPLCLFLKESEELRYLIFNKAGENLTGYKHEELLGKTDQDIYSTEKAAHLMAQDLKAITSDNVLDFPEETIKVLNDESRVIHTKKVAIRDSNGDVKYLLGISEDITERKCLEAEQKKLEEQLRSSQKIEAIGRLAGGIAHDFNNLLSVILNFNNFALDSVKDGNPIKQDLLEVKKAAERAALLTRQLLAFSRRQVLHPVQTNLNMIALDCEKMFRRTIGEDIVLKLKLSPDIGITMVDPGQIEQVLLNLVINARDAMPNGGYLTIQTESVEIAKERPFDLTEIPYGQYALLSVSDTGIGMDEQTKNKIFEPFFTTKTFGSGLGLPTVYGIIKQSGGYTYVSSELGKGSSFKIFFPIVDAVGADDIILQSDLQLESETARGRETILIAEDEDALRLVIKRILEAEGYNVLSAIDGEEACLIFEQYRSEIALLLTDVVMPKMGGNALANRLLKTSPKLKILYISGYSDDSLLSQSGNECEKDFLPKPFSSSELKRKVRIILDKLET